MPELEGQEQPTVEELGESYSNTNHALSRVGSSSIRLNPTPEQRAEDQRRRVELKTESNAVFSQMVDVATGQFLSTAPDQRLSYLQNLRTILTGRQANLGQVDMEQFSDHLTVTIAERLTPPQQPK